MGHNLVDGFAKMPDGYQIYLQPTPFIDWDTPSVIQFAQSTVGEASSDIDKAVRLYYRVRDEIRYDPYHIELRPEMMKASAVLARGFGFCIEKAVLLAAAARALTIPSRLGFADVRNHLATERLRQWLQTDLFVFHGYTELWLEGRWVKATPAFNRSLCERFGVKPLEFDGRHDSVFHPFDANGQVHMEYVRDRGQFADVPFEAMVAELKRHYPRVFNEQNLIDGDFEHEAAIESVRR
ncbi:MAG: transglutaminase family protein [Acidobacteriota bacterium]|nr:transglutaminase family protein [Blastocatellia bacterium]MDW8238785.1 transglutaminase family protein [Acidobacteriota bacterium]